MLSGNGQAMFAARARLRQSLTVEADALMARAIARLLSAAA